MALGFPFNNRGFIKAIFDAIGTSVGGAFGSKLSDKITGIPSPLSAAEQGKQAADFMDVAYPGTTPWDRLGAGGAGSTQAVSGQNIEQQKMKQEKIMQSKALTTQAIIEERRNRAELIKHGSNYGIDGIKQLLDAYAGFGGSDYDNPTKQSRELLPATKHEKVSAGNKMQAEAGYEDVKFRNAQDIIDSEMHRNRFGSASSSTAYAAKAIGGSIGNLHGDAYRLFSRNREPRFRFNPIRNQKNTGNDFFNAIKKKYGKN